MALRWTIPEEERTDRTYWEQSLPMRIYLRIFYGISGGIWIGGILMGCLGAPTWMQWGVAALVFVGALIWRMAFPNGMSKAVEWINEGMLEAAKDGEAKGYNFAKNSDVAALEKRLQIQKEQRAKREEEARKAAAEKQARKQNRKKR